MNREIKFRAWDKKGESMSPLTPLRDIHNFCPSDKGRLEKDFIWMQFTGLKDKNGKEIYEGDIMMVENILYHTDPQKIEVRYIDGGFVMVTSRWEKRGLGLKQRQLVALEKGNCCEIIGNIYENKELLK